MKCKGIKKECDIVATTHFFFVLVCYHPVFDGSENGIKKIILSAVTSYKVNEVSFFV